MAVAITVCDDISLASCSWLVDKTSFHFHYSSGRYVEKETYVDILANLATCCHWQKFYYANFLSCICNSYNVIEDMATFTALAKKIPPKIRW
jgi:hypothetical protein